MGIIMDKLKWLRYGTKTVKCYNAKQYEQAQAYAEQALTLGEKTFGEYHANVVKSLYNLVEIHKMKEEYEKAEAYCLQALHIREHNFGKEDVYLVEDLDNLALIYEKMNRTEEVKKIDERIAALKNKQ